jgi:hypothetical protein
MACKQERQCLHPGARLLRRHIECQIIYPASNKKLRHIHHSLLLQHPPEV